MDAQSGESFQKAPRGTLKRVRKKAGRQDAARLKAFREAVWRRECDRCLPMMTFAAARCQGCQAWVYRPDDGGPAWRFGEVDHIKPRSTCSLSERYDPANGQLLCQECHRRKHQ